MSDVNWSLLIEKLHNHSWSNTAIARELGMRSYTTVSAWRKGERVPKNMLVRKKLLLLAKEELTNDEFLEAL